MTPKVAIIYTGELRTIHKTLPYFKKHCLLNDNHHVFAVLQDDNNTNIESHIKCTMGENLKSFELFNKNDNFFNQLKNRLVENLYIADNWKEYLKISGSMVEYYQMYLAYMSIVKKEYSENFSYDYIIRIRCDCVLTNYLSFDWTTWDEEEIKNRLYKIKEIFSYDTIVSMDVFKIFMTSLFDKSRMWVTENIDRNYFTANPCNHLFTDNTENIYVNKIKNYLLKGKFMLSFRENIIYCLKREYFKRIYQVGVCYGLSKSYDDGYWFNSECQLKCVCYDGGIDIFDSVTNDERESLYNYDKSKYMDGAGNLFMQQNVFFFLMRN